MKHPQRDLLIRYTMKPHEDDLGRGGESLLFASIGDSIQFGEGTVSIMGIGIALHLDRSRLKGFSAEVAVP